MDTILTLCAAVCVPHGLRRHEFIIIWLFAIRLPLKAIMQGPKKNQIQFGLLHLCGNLVYKKDSAQVMLEKSRNKFNSISRWVQYGKCRVIHHSVRIHVLIGFLIKLER
jgi:uncharacterized metal-binding protein